MAIEINKNNKASFEYAKRLTAHYSKSFYISARFLPKKKRWATFALYGFCRFADNLIDNPRERSQEELVREVNFIAKELKTAFRTGESEHPVIRPFVETALSYQIPIKYPLELLKGVKMDLLQFRYQNFQELYVFCYRVAAVVGLMMTHILGHKHSDAFKFAEQLGIAMQLTNILRDIKEDKDMGRIYLPLDELGKFGLDENHILEETFTDGFKEFMKYQIDRAKAYYDEANLGIKILHTDSQFAIYSASKIYKGILHQIESENYNPFNKRVFVSQSKKVRILFKEVLKTKALLAHEKLQLFGV